MLVDSHCHLNHLDLTPHGGRLEGVLEDAEGQGVQHMLCVGIDWETLPEVLAIAERHPQVSASVGVHPNEQDGEDPSVEALIERSRDGNVVAIGETGLDYFRSEGDLEWQRDRFRRHIQVARHTGKPLIIHTREAREDTIRVMREEEAGEAGGVMHCFTEDWDMARQALDQNFYLSFSGIVTFKNAAQVKEVARRTPDDRLLVETDAPYLAPVPHRGKPNYPAYVRHVAEYVAELRGISLNRLADLTTENFYRLFKDAAA